ncbi:MAG TPA: CAP domain-containing protein [Chloroflexia bacterium]|nr:CAP domain-containing protein [Chloroflexia bacterium]
MQAENYSNLSYTTSNYLSYSHLSARKGLRLRRLVPHVLATLTMTFAMLAQPLTVARNAQALGATGAPTQKQYFDVTGKSVAGDFLSTFQRYGLERIGYPLSDERVENGQTVQYFERVRMERHPELASKGYGVLFTRLGVDLNGGDKFAKVAPFASTAQRAYISQTGHSLSEPFLSYWKNNGGVEFFGYPIAEPMDQDGMYVQWFERARMEYHQELAKSGKAVQLSLLGRAALGGNGPQAQTVSTQKQQLPAAEVKLTPMESFLLKAINEQRAAAGARQVTLDAAVTDLSRARSGDMAERNYFSHTTPEGTKFISMLVDRKVDFKYGGEILARNNYPSQETAQVAINSYLNSAGHKAVMLDGRYTAVGVGYAFSAEDEMHYFTVIFIEQ